MFLIQICVSPNEATSQEPRKQVDEELVKCVLEAVRDLCLDPEIKGHIQAYSAASSEAGRYGPLCKLINTALVRLAGLHNSPLFGSQTGPGYHRNGYTFKENTLNILALPTFSKQFTTSEDSARSRIKPDMILTSLEAARHIVKKGANMTFQELLKLGVFPPRDPATAFNTPSWAGCLCAMELKRNPDTQIHVPEDSWYERPQRLDCIEHLKDVTIVSPNTTRKHHPAQTINTGDESKESRHTKKTKLEDVHEPALAETQPNSSTRDRERPPPAVQCALYAAERMGSALATDHVIGMLVVDDVLWIWWYDRQGAIQSCGLNFIHNLPYLFAFLFAFQRFDLQMWGFHPTYDSRINQVHIPGAPAVEEPEITLPSAHCDGYQITVAVNLRAQPKKHHGLRGRFSDVRPVKVVKVERDASQPRSSLSSESLQLLPQVGDEDYVVKIYHADVSRVSEPEIIERAQTVAMNDSNVRDHIPYILCYQRVDDVKFSTKRVRTSLGLVVGPPDKKLDKSNTFRALRIIVFRKLNPIQELDGKGMMTALLQSIKCHFALWRKGVYHNDLSVANLMYHETGGKIHGVVNDWDLATVDESTHDGFEKTGTVPYMPLELLTNGIRLHPLKLKRLYRHENESFMWIMAALFLRYNMGKRVPNPSVEAWETGDWNACLNAKISFLSLLLELPVDCTTPWTKEWSFTRGFLRWVEVTNQARKDRVSGPVLEDDPFTNRDGLLTKENPEETYRAFWERVWKYSHLPSFPAELAYIITEIL
ncbi:hypothetical protein OF83DRAFT_336393 [Amylostereum chailletii]|nr:hypothetical protein OF83DRAFT_336393 [Amylostereum chailletii]